MAEELHALAERCRGQPVRVETLLEATAARGLNWLLIVLALPFVTPLPMPGVSTPFGVLIALIGAGLAAGRRVRLPDRLLHRELSPAVAGRLLDAAAAAARHLGVLARPRLHGVVANGWARRLGGLLISLCGCVMTLPLPVPLSDGIPAATVTLLALGALAGDGLVFLAGCAMFGVTVTFFVVVSRGSVELVARVRRRRRHRL
jgi:hypothetical protein